jgi:hypothetical protein
MIASSRLDIIIIMRVAASVTDTVKWDKTQSLVPKNRLCTVQQILAQSLVTSNIYQDRPYFTIFIKIVWVSVTCLQIYGIVFNDQMSYKSFFFLNSIMSHKVNQHKFALSTSRDAKRAAGRLVWICIEALTHIYPTHLFITTHPIAFCPLISYQFRARARCKNSSVYFRFY